jgi:predicted lipid-binding transport protein (Tim44 family)
MIVTAFARGERDTLRPLLSDEVFETFDREIRAREAKKERVDFTFLSLKAARITGAEMKAQVAEIVVTFQSEVMLAGYDPSGALIEGDAKTPHQVTEVWTFARDTRSSDPNWTLISTASNT